MHSFLLLRYIYKYITAGKICQPEKNLDRLLDVSGLCITTDCIDPDSPNGRLKDLKGTGQRGRIYDTNLELHASLSRQSHVLQ